LNRSVRSTAAIICSRCARSLAATVVACTLLASSALADTPTPGALYRDGPSGRYLLDGSWYTRADPGDRGVAAGFPRASGLTGWLQTSVPNAANAGNFSSASYLGGVQWYRKDFSTPSAAARASWVLRFESVNYRATVWLNGHAIGRHTGAYLPFELDARSIRRRGVNRLVVRVDSRRGELDVPSLAERNDGRFVGGWWNYTGILREVYLRRVERLDFSDVLVRPRLPCRTCAATVTVDALVRNVGRRPTVAAAEGRLAGRTLVFDPVRVAPGRSRRLRASLRIDNPILWSPESPHLYAVRLVLRDGEGSPLQRYDVHTGIRSLELRNGHLLLNGRSVDLRGASMHEDDPAHGAALTPDDIRRNFELLRGLGATMTRAHYPMHPLALELADRYGIVVWSEIPVYQMQDRLFRNDRVRGLSLRMMRGMVLRDRNHPSVIVWSIGNENTQKPGAGFRRYVRQARRATRRLDPTRLVGLAFPGYPTIGRQSLYASFDALGVNDYFGWYPGPDDSIADRTRLGPYLDALHRHYPRQALFVTEFGAEANRAGPLSEKGTYEFQSDFLAYHLSVYATKPFLNGALVWILRDFRVKPGYDGGNPEPGPPVNFKGLVGDDGDKKPAFTVVEHAFEATRAGQR
jgi:beta-glucuronidase